MSQKILKALAISLGIILLPFVLFFAAWMGFWLDFHNNFDPADARADSLYVIVLPAIIIAGIVIAVRTLRARADARRKETMRQDIHREMGLPGEAEAQQILHALEIHGSMTLEDLAELTGIDKQHLLPQVQRLVQAKTITQHATLDGAVLSLPE